MATVKLDPAKGIQIPNLTTTERNAISSPETGAIIWNTTTSEINQYNGSAWEITYTPVAGISSSADATAITIDSSENVLVAQSSTAIPGIGNTTVGSALRSDGVGAFSVSGNPVAYFNRSSSDGTVVNFNKDGTTVGNIGVVSSDRMYFSTADGLGLQFDKDNNRIIPCDNVGGYNSNVELGDENLAFTNLFLTGGIKFDSRSSKLDDYEEGTFTASFGGSSKTGNYTKIGRTVTVTVTLDTTASAFSQITGFPFSANGRSAVSICRGNGSSPSMTSLNYGIGGTTLTFTNHSGTATSISTSGTVRIDICGTYQTA